MAKLKPIGLSFKNTEDDRKLYEWIYKHSNISGFIKDILRERMNSNEVVSKVSMKESNDNLIDLGDF